MVDRVLSDEQVEDFMSRGFVVVPQVVAGELVAASSALAAV